MKKLIGGARVAVGGGAYAASACGCAYPVPVAKPCDDLEAVVTVAGLKRFLSLHGVKYPSGARKAALYDLALAHGFAQQGAGKGA